MMYASMASNMDRIFLNFEVIILIICTCATCFHDLQSQQLLLHDQLKK